MTLRWIACLLLAAPLAAQQVSIEEQLAKIADQLSLSIYQGDTNLRQLLQKQEQEGAAAGPELLQKVGQAYLRLGREREAITQLQAALAALPEDAPPGRRARLLRDLAVAQLRLGETENCCARNTPVSCILPLRGDALHSRPEGSRQAIAALRELLRIAPRRSPERPLAEWLLNLAHMTLGEYPQNPEEGLRIDPDHLESEAPFPAFPNVAGELGVDHFSLAGGVVLEDLDGDGDLDILTSSHDLHAPLRLYLQDSPLRFRECAAEAGLGRQLGGLNLIHGDYDNDGDADILVLRGAWLHDFGQHPNSLLRNEGPDAEGQLRFRDVTLESGLGQVHLPSQTAAFADYDNDGDLDLFVGNESSDRLRAPCQLFRNDGPDTGERPRFVDVAREAGVQNFGYTKGVAWGDFDDDGDPDLYLSNLGQANRLYRNLGQGKFQDVAQDLGVDQPERSFPTWFWDYDNDGQLDLFVSNYCRVEDVASYYTGRPSDPASASKLYRGAGGGRFQEVASELGLARPMMIMGCNYGDLDGDGYLDLYLGTGHPRFDSVMPNLLLRNDRGSGFQDVTMAAGLGHLQKGHAIAFGDLDRDGDLDVFEQMGGAYAGDGFHDALFLNPGFDRAWLGLKLVGTRSNRSAIGARVSLTLVQDGTPRTLHRRVGQGASFGAGPLELHLGLGKATRIRRLEVHWPASGEHQVFRRVPVNQRLRITEGRSDFETL